jgi:2-oxoisovalerate dehydrogenase E2 component (dihydrolipoyl transacylase)
MGTYLYKLPDIGEGVVEAEITAWHVAVGDTVSEEDPIADAMTDKATIELTSPVDGVIKSMACEEGDMLAVGAVLVSLEIEGAGNDQGETDVPAVKDKPEPEPKQTAPELALSPAPSPAPKIDKPITRGLSGGKVQASPAVRDRAARLNIDLAVVPTAGPRVTHADLDAYLTAGAPIVHTGQDTSSSQMQSSPALSLSTSSDAKRQETPSSADLALPGETRQKVIGLRRVIATRMAESKRNIPHFTYVEEMDVTALEALRGRMNKLKTEEKPKLTVLPFIIRALAVTLIDWPQFNARYEDEKGYVSRFEDLNLGIAAQTDGGLIVPVLQAAQSKSVWELAIEIARLADAARTNQLSTNDLSGATTTLTSLGPLGGIVTTPVINRPEVAIFGPNKIREKLVLNGGDVTARKVMNFSVSCDHRVIDGYDAAKMMQDLKARIEDPTSIFVL